MKQYDMHVHSRFSHDSEADMEEACAQAIKKGLAGLAFTDHCDLIDRLGYDHIRASGQAAQHLQKSYAGRLKILRGVEIGDGIYEKEEWNRLLQDCSFDVVLGSLHTKLTGREIAEGYTGYRCLADFDEEQIRQFLVRYYEHMLEMATQMDFDVLTHLTLPLRYLNGRLHRGVSLDKQQEIIEEILKTIIRRGIGLELNTSGIETDWGELMPSPSILKRYYDLGGRRITLGSDAHRPDRLACGLQQGADIAKEIGFTAAYYYENRVPVPYSLS